MNTARLPLVALGALLACGALYLATREDNDPVIEISANELPLSIEEASDAAEEERTAALKDRSAGVVVDTPYGAWLGIELVYEAEFFSVVEVTTGDSTQVVEHSLSGRQLIRMVDRTHEGFVAAFSWPELDLSIQEDGVEASPGRTDALKEELARPVLVYYDDKDDPSGVQQALRFTRGTSPNGRSWARALVACQRAAISSKSEDGFDLVEADASGRHRARYEILELSEDVARVSREKVEALDGFEWARTSTPPEVSGEGVVEFSEGWFSRVEWSERSLLSVEAAKIQIQQRFSADVQRTSIDVFDGDGLDGWELEDDWRSFDGNTESEAAQQSASDELDADLLEGADVGALVDQLISIDMTDAPAAQALLAAERLALLIKEDPAVLAMLETELSSGGLPEGAAKRILGAIATAGSPEAQETLRELFLLPNPPDGLRDATALALFQLPTVTPETVNTFSQVLSDQEASVELRSASWLLLGAFAETGSDTELTSRLVQMEREAREAGELVPWLEALGNTRSPDVYEAANRHLSSDDPEARLSAVRALRHLNSSEATQALAGRAALDQDAHVRREAITLLAGREQEGVLPAVSELLQEEPLSSVRRAALDALANRPMDDELLSLLSSVASSDPDSSLRSYALELLEP
ncbi:MAG: HEAT repeat domain-containing protein [Planctomycetes bacterium]|nr:HEAT repeat domain-containing protein [Planctomycetota bacterium]